MGAETRFVIPKTDSIVRDPRTKTPLPIDGAIVPWIGPEGRYWRRREMDGSIIVFAEKPAAKTAAERVEIADKKDGGKK